MSSFFARIVFITIVASYCADALAAEIRLSPYKEKNYYPWAVFLSQGPIRWTSPSPRTRGQNLRSIGHAYRLVQLVHEIYDTILVEEVAVGEEGCCKRVTGISVVDLDALVTAFEMNGEVNGFEFVEWDTSATFRFKFKGRKFIATVLNRSRLSVTEEKILK